MPTIIPINPIHSGIKHTLSASRHASEYHNHLGCVDNFTLTFKSGTGDSAVDTTTHWMELTSGVGVGNSYFRTKSAYGIPALPVVVEFRCMLGTITDGAGGVRDSYVGAMNSADLKGVYFHQKADDTWECVSKGDTNTHNAAITALVTADFLDIIYNRAGAKFYVNGSIVASLAYDAIAGTFNHGAYIIATGAVSGARKLDIDYLGLIHSSGGVV